MNTTPSLLPHFTDFSSISHVQGVVLSQFQQKKPAHAYLFMGASGLGKYTFAKFLTGALFCEQENSPCGACPACERFFNNQQADIHVLRNTEGKRIGIEEVREVLRAISCYSFQESTHIVFIEPVESLTIQAQNALLKTLEEPVTNVVFLLMTHQRSAMLGTIASRCFPVALLPWPNEIMKSTLIAYNFQPDVIEKILPLAGGNIGNALAMLEENDEQEKANHFISNVVNMQNPKDVIALSSTVKDSKDDLYLIAIEQLLYRMLLKKTQQIDHIDGISQQWRNSLEHMPLTSINALLQDVLLAKKMRQSHVNWHSSIDQVLLNIQEEMNRWQS